MKNYFYSLLLMLSGGVLLAQQPVSPVTEGEEQVTEKPLGLAANQLHNDPEAQGIPDNIGIAAFEDVTFLTMGADGSYFYVRNSITDNTTRVCYRAEYESREMPLFNLSAYCTTGEPLTIKGLYPDHKAQQLAILLGTENSDIGDVVIVDLNTNVMDNYLSGVSSEGLSWFPDGSSLLYHKWSSDNISDTRYRERTATLLHKVGASSKTDLPYFSAKTNGELAISDTDIPTAYFDRQLQAVIGVVKAEGQPMRLYLKLGDLYNTSSWITLAEAGDMVADFTASERLIYYRTSRDAPNYRIVASEVRWPDINNAEPVVPEYPDLVITDLQVNADGLYYVTRAKDGTSQLWLKTLRKDKPELIHLPFPAHDIRMEIPDPQSGNIWVHITRNDIREMRYFYNRKQGSFVEQPLNLDPGKETRQDPAIQ